MKTKKTKAIKGIPAVSAMKRLLVTIAIMVAVVILLGAYNFYTVRSAVNVENIDSLSGQRIGCCTAWETDYLLTPRDDITLLRYETNAAALIALGFGQVDAVGVDEPSLAMFRRNAEGFEALPEPIARLGSTCLASHGCEEKGILAEFNQFAKEFQASDEYDNFVYRAALTDGETFRMKDIPLVENGKPIRVGYVPEYYPENFYSIADQRPDGYGVELILRFAYAYGYSVEFVEVSSESVYIELAYDRLDFGLDYETDIYAEETEAAGYMHMTEPYAYFNVCLIKMKDGEKLRIKGDVGC